MFQNNTLDSPKRWLDAGYRVFPCQEKKPLVEWKTENKKIFYDGNAVGLYLQGVTAFDVDNRTAHNFIKEYLKPCGAVLADIVIPIHIIYSKEIMILNNTNFPTH